MSTPAWVTGNPGPPWQMQPAYQRNRWVRSAFEYAMQDRLHTSYHWLWCKRKGYPVCATRGEQRDFLSWMSEAMQYGEEHTR